MSNPSAFDIPGTPDSEDDYRVDQPQAHWTDIGPLDSGHPLVDRHINRGTWHGPRYGLNGPRPYPA